MATDRSRVLAAKELLEAVARASAEAIVLAVEHGANVNERDEAGETALTWATGVDHTAESALICVQTLLRLGARVAEEQSGGLGTSVHRAAECGQTEALQALIAADGRVALELFDDFCRTPLMCAVDYGHLNEARFLLAAGANVNAHDSGKMEDTPLALAVLKKDVAMVELLITSGADPTIPGWMGLTAGDRACEWSKAGVAPELRRIFELVQAEVNRRTMG